MAIINGTPGNDTLNGTAGDDTITGGTGNDTINAGAGNDTIFAGPETASATPLTFNWMGLADGASWAGQTQNTGGINVAVTYVNQGSGLGIVAEDNDNPVYNGPGETFPTNSSGYMSGTGASGNTSQVDLNFSAVSGSTFQNAVQNVAFRINDIDRNNSASRIDQVTVLANHSRRKPCSRNDHAGREQLTLRQHHYRRRRRRRFELRQRVLADKHRGTGVAHSHPIRQCRQRQQH